MYFAQIDENNLVTNVIVADQAFVDALGGTWIQTDITGTSPINYAGIGFTWTPDMNAFVLPKPYPSWTLNSTTAQWGAPVPYPNDGKNYSWDESTLSWVLLNG